MILDAGLTPQLLPQVPRTDTLLLCLVWASFLPALPLFPIVWRIWHSFVNGLRITSAKTPAAERTMGERLSRLAAQIPGCLAWATMLYCAVYHLRGGIMATDPGTGVLTIAAAVAATLIFQVAAYALIGYAFASRPVDIRQWISALLSTQAMTAYALMLPALCALLFPEYAMVALAVGATLYFLLRIALWVKCFRIYYTQPFSIFYFFLYLCTIEMVPLLLPAVVALII